MAESFSQEQIDMFKDCFNLYDSKRNGKVEKDDLTKIMRALGYSVTHLDIHEIMKKHGKPVVTFPECLKMLADQKPRNIEREILGCFTLLDKYKQGYISRKELEHYLMKGGEGMTNNEVQQLLANYGFDKMINQINYKDLSERIAKESPTPQY